MCVEEATGTNCAWDGDGALSMALRSTVINRTSKLIWTSYRRSSQQVSIDRLHGMPHRRRRTMVHARRRLYLHVCLLDGTARTHRTDVKVERRCGTNGRRARGTDGDLDRTPLEVK